MATRDRSIDILRSIALIGMIVAHCHPHELLMQLREFDVPLIVYLSGVSFLLSSQRRGENITYFSYCWRRFKRLVFPTWLFLFIYYGILYIGLTVTGNLVINIDEITDNFTLMTGWYVWIIRVFLIIAIVAPLVLKVTKKLDVKIFLVLLPFFLVSYELIAKSSDNQLYYYLTMAIPYIAFFAFGTVSDRLKRSHYILVIVSSLGVFLCFALHYFQATGVYQITHICKYPPRLYYTSYAFTMVCTLWLLRSAISSFLTKLKFADILSFIGSHTLWIYFWHIIILLVVGQRFSNSILLFFVVLVLAIGIDYIQVILITKIIKMVKSELIKSNLSLLFMG